MRGFVVFAGRRYAQRTMANVLVTGGAGFIGSHVVDRLCQAGHAVTVVDWEKKTKMYFHRDDVSYITTSFVDDAVLDRVRAQEFAAIFHLAAQTSVVASVADPLFDAQVNIVDSIRLLEAAKGNIDYFLFVSTGGGIYGDATVFPVPFSEDAKPLSPYGVSKLAFERYVASYYRTHGLQYGILRPSNVYGPRQVLEQPMGDGGVMPIFLDKLIVTRESLMVYGDGEQTRDFVFVDDVARAAVMAFEQHAVGAWNIATGVELSVNQLATALQEIHGATIPMTYMPERAGEVRRSALDIGRTTEQLGWQPETALSDGLRRTYNWYKETFGRA